MKKIDTTHWKEFRLGELFEPIRGTVKRLQILPEGTTPVIAAARSKQGIAGYYAVETPYKNQITVSCNGVGCGSAFYHNYPFNISGDAMVLLEKIEMPEYAKRFICCLIDGVFTRKYSYAEKCSPEKAKIELIKLPADKSGDPDFAYMEQYIRSLEQRVQATLTTFEQLIQLPKHAVDTTQWKAYKIGDLFDVVKGKRLTKTNMKEGVINYIGATAFNNGITAQIANDDNLHQAGTITVCYNGSIGQAFYQNEPYWATDDVNVLYPKFEMSKYVALFIVPILKTLGQKYGYVDKWTQDKMKETEMPLPTTPDGTPDFAYMEQYMRRIEQRVQQNLEKIA